jgi:hypothetical protein
MKIGQIVGTVLFVTLALFALIFIGWITIAIFTKLGLFSDILIAAIKAFGFIFIVFVLIPAAFLALFLRGTFWGFFQAWLSIGDISDAYRNWRQKDKENQRA